MITSVTSITSFLPPVAPGYAGAALTAAQLGVTLLSFSGEANSATCTPYSKFAKTIDTKTKQGTMVPSRVGMTIIYAPAFTLAALICTLGGTSEFLPDISPAAALCAIHFGKRVLEVLFLHKYSGNVSLSTSSAIGIFYSIYTLLIGSVAEQNPSDMALTLGTALLSIGLIGNFYHHYLLATLRQDQDGEKRYVAPRGGLFEYVAAPHYFFELIGWLGIAVVSNHLNAFLVFTAMCSYLGGRSISQNSWNKEKFPKEWPKSRKNLIPFVF